MSHDSRVVFLTFPLSGMMCAGIQTGKNQNKVQATCSCALNAILTSLFGNIFMTHIAFIHPFSFNWLNAISILIFGNIFMIHVSYIHPSTHQRQECGACPCSHLLRHPHHQCGKTQGGISQRSKEWTWNTKVQPDLAPNLSLVSSQIYMWSQVLEFYRPFSHTFSRNLCLSFVLSKRTVFSKAITNRSRDDADSNNWCLWSLLLFAFDLFLSWEHI